MPFSNHKTLRHLINYFLIKSFSFMNTKTYSCTFRESGTLFSASFIALFICQKDGNLSFAPLLLPSPMAPRCAFTGSMGVKVACIFLIMMGFREPKSEPVSTMIVNGGTGTRTQVHGCLSSPVQALAASGARYDSRYTIPPFYDSFTVNIPFSNSCSTFDVFIFGRIAR